MSELVEKIEKNLLETYNRNPIVLDHGRGVYLYDVEGKGYLDFGSGIGVCALGYGDAEYTEALKNQIDKIMHVSNLFYTVPMGNAVTGLAEATGLDKVFLCNSGTEAIEGALKLARKYAIKKGSHGRTEIISMNKAFHGRSMGALSVTGTEKYRTPFEPLISGVKFAEYNDLESVKKLVDSKTCAILLETLQGEGGIYVADQEFIQGIRKICDDNDILMICDEIQCGMGRTGKMFAYEYYGILPDVVTMAKGIGCGTTVGAFAVSKAASIGLEAGDHGTTFGGNPFASASICTVLDIFRKRDIVSHVQEVGKYMWEQLEKLSESKKDIKEHRGMGLMQGLEFVPGVAVGDVVKEGLANGLILIVAASNTVRFVPPLVIEKEHVDKMVSILDKILK